ncbi:MAG: HPr family phosphocarrier protein [Rhizobiaceae bacterium]|nr:HPr family phosphocarrier protein [Rhizobiaceae bacterium]
MTAATPEQEAEKLTRRMTIVNKRGLHARASARFVETAGGFDAVVEVEKDGITVGGTSIMGLMMLAASPGCFITVHVSGPEAGAAMDALDDLVSAGFGEDQGSAA